MRPPGTPAHQGDSGMNEVQRAEVIHLHLEAVIIQRNIDEHAGFRDPGRG